MNTMRVHTIHLNEMINNVESGSVQAFRENPSLSRDDFILIMNRSLYMSLKNEAGPGSLHPFSSRRSTNDKDRFMGVEVVVAEIVGYQFCQKR